jgi:predicted transcriptional regulator
MTSPDKQQHQRQQPSEAELQILRYVSEHPAVSVREVADAFALSHGLARTTVLTLMERLRKKEHLTRRKVRGVFVYTAKGSRTKLLAGLVGRFVDKALGGSIRPFVNYLLEKPSVSKGELEELRELVDGLEAKDKDKDKEGRR